VSGPPELAPFGLVLHHDSRWSHEGQPILNTRLREHFDRSVRYLPEERKYIVTLGHFRGEIEVEECGFFVRVFDSETGRIELSDLSHETLDPASLHLSAIDEAVICLVKRDLCPEGLPARFMHGAHSELMLAVDEEDGAFFLVSAGQRFRLELG